MIPATVRPPGGAPLETEIEALPKGPAHAPAPGACAALAQRKARIRLREAVIAEGAEPVADLRLQAPRRHKLAQETFTTVPP